MRTATAPELAILASTAYKPLLRVRVVGTDSVERSLTALASGDYVVSARGSDNIDQPIAEATVSLWRGDAEASSLSPLITASALYGHIDIGCAIYIDIGAIAVGGTPVSADWKPVFEGVIDDVEMAGNGLIEILCRDNGSAIQDTNIETAANYGSSGGVALETVIQAILDDNMTSPPTLYVPTASGKTVTEFQTSAGTPVYDAIRELARSKEFEVRYKWDSTTSAFRLTLFEPDRAKSVADHTFGSADYHTLEQFTLSRVDVRNAITVTYTDTAGDTQTVSVSDAASITKYGRRALALDATALPIKDSTAATAYANAALSDVKEPKATLRADLPLFWPAELFDLYDFSANGTHFDTTQQLAAVEVSWEISAERARTWITGRGSVAGAWNIWLVQGNSIAPYVAPTWTETLTFPAQDSARLTLDFTDPQLRMIQVAFSGDSLADTDAATGPYVFDVGRYPVDPTRIEYDVYFYDAYGQVKIEHRDFLVPPLGVDMENLGAQNLLLQPGFPSKFVDGISADEFFEVSLVKLASLLDGVTFLSSRIEIKPSDAADEWEPIFQYLDGAGTVLSTSVAATVSGVTTYQYRPINRIGYNSAAVKMRIGARAVGTPVGTATIRRGVINIGERPIHWTLNESRYLERNAETASAVQVAASIAEIATREGYAGVPGQRTSASSVTDATGTTVVLDTEQMQLLALLLAADVTNSLGEAVDRALQKSVSADPNTLDSVSDGSSYGKALLTALTSGQVDLSKSGVIQKYLTNLQRSSGNATLASAIVQYLADTGHAGASMQEATGRALNRLLAKVTSGDPDTVDGVPDGSTYARTLLTALTSGQVDLSKAGVINKLAQHILRTGGGTDLQTIITQLRDDGHLEDTTQIADEFGTDRDVENVWAAVVKAMQQASLSAAAAVIEITTREGVFGDFGERAVSQPIYSSDGLELLLDTENRATRNLTEIETEVGTSAPLRTRLDSEDMGVVWYDDATLADWMKFAMKAYAAKCMGPTQGQFGLKRHDNGASGAAKTLNFVNGNWHRLQLSASCTLTLSNPVVGCEYTIEIRQDATAGGFTVTWPAAVKWDGGTTPTQTATAGRVDVYRLIYNGTDYIARREYANVTAS